MNNDQVNTRPSISIWFIVGVALLVNGIIIFVAGMYELVEPPPPEVRVVMFQYHASIWWGALLAILGAVYCRYFAPSRVKS